MNTETFSNDVASGNFNSYVTQTNINDFREKATPREMEAVSEALGIGSDEWDDLTPEAFSARMDEFNNSGKVEEIKKRNAKRKELLNISEAEAKEKIPTTLRATEDGAVRYKQGEADIGVLKEGDNYILHDYTTSKTSKTLTRAEAESALNEIRGIVENGAQSENSGAGDRRYGFVSYDDKQIENWKNSKRIVIYENESQFLQFIKEAISEPTDKKMYFGKVSPQLASLIEEETGINVEGYNCSLSSYEIKKIFKDHGTENTEAPRGQRAITPDDIVKIPDVIQSPTSVVREQVDYDGKPMLKFVDSNEKLTVKAVVSDKRLDLRIHTAYAGIKKGNLSTLIAEQAAIDTPKASRGTVSNNSISQKETKINHFGKKVSEIVEGETESKVQTVKIDLWAKEHIKEYGSLNALNKSAVRATIRAAQKNKFDEEAIVTFARFASKSGLSVSFDKSKLITGIDEAGNETYANGMLYGNTVYVNPDSKIKHDILLIHELLHELITKKGAEKLIKSAVRNMDKNRQKEIYKRYEKLYKRKNKGKLPANFEAIVVDEITAHYAQEVFSDIDVLAYLDGKDPTIKDRIIGFFSKSARAYSEDTKLSAAARKFARQYRKLFNEVAERNYQGNAISVDAKLERYALSENENQFQLDYEKNVEAVLKGTYSGDNVIVVGRTPKVLTDIGLNQLPLAITANHIYTIAKTEAEAKAEGRYSKNNNYHGLGEAAVKQIREKIKEPIMVLTHQEFTPEQQKNHVQSKRVVVVVELVIDGKQVICPIEVDAEILHNSNMLDGNLITTYFDKNNFETLIREAVAKENSGDIGFYYIDTKKANSLLQGPGYQLPQHLASRLSASSTIIRQISENVNRKISDFTQSQQFKRWFGDWQKKPDKASKVVNSDGTPKIVYHGSNEKFTVFDITKSRSYDETLNYDLPGFYFSESIDESSSYGEIGEYYISIKNPYDGDIYKLAKEKGSYRKAYDYLVSQGYDGVINTELGEGFTEYIVFKPEQIKSATENLGTFDRNNPDVRYSLPDEDFDSPTLESVAKEREKRKISWKEKFFTAKDSIYIDTVDEMYGVEKYISKYGKNKYAKALVQQARASRSQAQTMIGSVQYDVFAKDVKKIGKGIHQIMKPIRQRGAENVRKFEDYMLHRLNVDRMTLEERSLEWTKADREALEAINGKLAQNKAEISRLEQEILNLGSSKEDLKLKKELQSNIAALAKENRRSEREAKQLDARIKNRLLENKPVFGENEKRAGAITAEESREIVAKYEKIHTEWNSIAEEIYSYLRALNHMRVEAGIISEEQEAYMNELYPHYVPAYRDFSYSGVGAVKGSRNLEISSTLRKAKGGGQDITEFERIIAEQTQQLLRAGRINQLANAVYESALASGDTDYVQVVESNERTIRKEFDAELQEWFNSTTSEERKKSGKRFLVGRTTNVLKSIGVKDCDIYFGGSKINKILTDNSSMKLSTIKSAVKMLEDPMLIMKSKTVEDSIVVFGEVYTEGDKPVMMSVLLNPKSQTGEILDYSVITSVYGRRESNLQNLIDTSKIYYVNKQKNRTNTWLKALGLQLPSALTKYGPINSISENSEKINSFDKFSEKFASQEDIYDAFNRDTEVKQKNKDNQITFYKDGEKITINVSREIFIGFEALNKPTFVSDSTVLNIANKINNVFKKIVTSYSPAFLIRNPIRDIQDAGLNSKHPALIKTW